MDPGNTLGRGTTVRTRRRQSLSYNPHDRSHRTRRQVATKGTEKDRGLCSVARHPSPRGLNQWRVASGERTVELVRSKSPDPPILFDHGLPWAGEKLVLHKLRFHPDFVAPFSPPCEGGAGGDGPGTTSYKVFPCSLPLSSQPSREARRIVFDVQGFRITPPAPPSQGGERDRSLATSFHRAQEKHASRSRPSSSVNTNFSPAQGDPAAAGDLRLGHRAPGRGGRRASIPLPALTTLLSALGAFGLGEFRGFSTNLNILRSICSDHGDPARRAAATAASEGEASACSELRLGCHPETPVIEPCRLGVVQPPRPRPGATGPRAGSRTGPPRPAVGGGGQCPDVRDRLGPHPPQPSARCTVRFRSLDPADGHRLGLESSFKPLGRSRGVPGTPYVTPAARGGLFARYL